MMLDVKRTFDALVETYAGSPEACRRILDNSFYRQISSALAGSHEYMAMEKLLELRADPRFDLIVLDTPPTRHALDFLEAPGRMLGLLDTSILRWFLRPYFVAGRLTLKVATRTGAVALRLADRYLGLQFLQDLSEFCLAFEGMYDGFKERAARVHALLRDPSSGFVLVASPARSALEEALFFYRKLRESSMPFVAFVVNRVRPDPATLPAPPAGTRVDLEDDLVQRLIQVHREQQAVALGERREVARLEVDAGEPLLLVPEMERDIHDLRGLREVASALLGATLPESRVRRAGRAGAAPSPSAFPVRHRTSGTGH
jgi:anion-transporting  ArsA/GET3 family ATPase